VEEDGQLLFRGVQVQGTPAEVVFSANRDLKSEELLAYELGYRVTPARTLSFDFATFYNHYDNLVGQQLLPPTLVTAPSPHLLLRDQWENHLRGDAFGGEVAAKWDITRDWKLIGSYTFLEVQLHHDRADTGTGERYFEGTSPQNQIQLRTYVDLTKSIQFNAAGYYVSSLSEQHIPGYVRVDLGLTWKPRENLQIGVGVQNLFDDRHPEFPDTGAYVVPSEPERAFYGRLTWRF
jgi:iron complex outermembrane receptor protein